MATVLSSPGVDFTRTIEFCPFQTTCRNKCRFVETTTQRFVRQLRSTGDVSVQLGKAALGSVLLLTGLMLSLTLFLMPVGAVMALLGVAFLATAGESPQRS